MSISFTWTIILSVNLQKIISLKKLPYVVALVVISKMLSEKNNNFLLPHILCILFSEISWHFLWHPYCRNSRWNFSAHVMTCHFDTFTSPWHPWHRLIVAEDQNVGLLVLWNHFLSDMPSWGTTKVYHYFIFWLFKLYKIEFSDDFVAAVSQVHLY